MPIIIIVVVVIVVVVVVVIITIVVVVTTTIIIIISPHSGLSRTGAPLEVLILYTTNLLTKTKSLYLAMLGGSKKLIAKCQAFQQIL